MFTLFSQPISLARMGLISIALLLIMLTAIGCGLFSDAPEDDREQRDALEVVRFQTGTPKPTNTPTRTPRFTTPRPTYTVTPSATRDNVQPGLATTSEFSIVAPDQVAIGQWANFTAVGLSGTNINYTWEFGDEASAAAGKSTSHIYNRLGVYTTSVIALNQGSLMTATHVITVLTKQRVTAIANATATAVAQETRLAQLAKPGGAATLTAAAQSTLTAQPTPSAPAAQTAAAQTATSVYLQTPIATFTVTPTPFPTATPDPGKEGSQNEASNNNLPEFNLSTNLVEASGVFTISEGDERGNFEVIVTLSNASSDVSNYTVDLITSEGLARTLEFPEDTLSKTVSIPIFDDELANENPEPIAVVLSRPEPRGQVKLGSDWNETIEVHDDDPDPKLEYAISDQMVSESAGDAALVLELSDPSAVLLKFTISSQNTSSTPATQFDDFVFVGASGQFFPGQTVITVPIKIIDDDKVEGPEDIDFVLDIADSSLATIPFTRGQLTILDNDLAVNATDDDSDNSNGVCDSRHCNLREAIRAANEVPGPDIIKFNLGDDRHIRLTEPLPAITDSIIIDTFLLTEADCTDGVQVELDGRSLDPEETDHNGLHLIAGNNVIRGLSIIGFDHGIFLDASSNNKIACNYLGLDRQGDIVGGNNISGILIEDGSRNLIGGTSILSRNLISGNNGSGLIIRGTGAVGNMVQGNHIAHNQDWGVVIEDNQSQNNHLVASEVLSNGGGVENYGDLTIRDTIIHHSRCSAASRSSAADSRSTKAIL
ncbi:MAG: PKD domain-containing protein, partial [Chloroflexota bacterium]